MKKIDCEFHYYLPEMMDYLATRKTSPYYYPENEVLVLRDGVPAKLSVHTNAHSVMHDLMNFGEDRVADMDRAGIDTAVMAVSAAVEELPQKEAVYYAKKSNDAVAELIQKYPGRFIGAAALPTMYVDAAMEELERCKKELGFSYWHTHSNYRNEHLYDTKYLPLLGKAAELGCAFYVHPHMSDDADMKNEGYVYAAPGLGFGLDTMKTATRIILNGTFDVYPNLHMVLGHLGEYFPFILDRIDNRFAWIKDDEVKMKHSISYYFKNKNVLVTTSGNMSKIAFECTKEAIGIDSIIFGSDYPYENLMDMMKFMDTLNLTQEEKEKVFHGNAEKYIL